MRTQQRAIWNTAAAAEVATTAAPSQSILHIFGGVVQYMHDDPHCDNLEDIFGDLPVTAMLVPLKRKTIEAKVQEGRGILMASMDAILLREDIENGGRM